MPSTLVHDRGPKLAPPRQAARAAPSRQEPQEAPAWQAIALMFGVVLVIAASLISCCFLAAKLATGHAY